MAGKASPQPEALTSAADNKHWGTGPPTRRILLRSLRRRCAAGSLWQSGRGFTETTCEAHAYYHGLSGLLRVLQQHCDAARRALTRRVPGFAQQLGMSQPQGRMPLMQPRCLTCRCHRSRSEPHVSERRVADSYSAAISTDLYERCVARPKAAPASAQVQQEVRQPGTPRMVEADTSTARRHHAGCCHLPARACDGELQVVDVSQLLSLHCTCMRPFSFVIAMLASLQSAATQLTDDCDGFATARCRCGT